MKKPNSQMHILNPEAKRHIFYTVYAHHLVHKHVGVKRHKLDDRAVLETIIFPYLLSHKNPTTILDVGRTNYQKFYNEFFIGRNLWTLERHKRKANFGAKNHVTGNVTKLEQYFKPRQFDVVIMNGVFGWGLNKPKDIEHTFAQVYTILKKNGIFILGWNNRPGLRPMHLHQIQALKKFSPYYFAPLNTDSFRCRNGFHTYNFFVKN